MRRISIVLFLATLVACSGKAIPDNHSKKIKCVPPIEIFIQASNNLNKNRKGQSMPVEVRVLMLRDREQFDNMDFEPIWRDNGEALGKDLIKSTSLTVFPGKLKIHPMKSSPEVAYIALVGIFRITKGRKWQYVVDVRNRKCSEDGLHTIIHASLRNNTISKPRNKPAS